MAVLSVVVPVFNEEANVQRFYHALTDVLKSQVLDGHEIIFIDDGSRDGTWSLLESLAAQDARVKAIHFSRNFGQQSALTAGLDHAAGDIIVMMDGDFQHPPSLIPALIAKWKEGYDIVYTKRERNESYGVLKNVLSKGFACVFNKLSEVEVGEGVLDFRLINRPVLESLKGLKERKRFLRGLVHWVGFKSTHVMYTAPARTSGTSNYPMRKALSLACTALLSFSSKPLYWSGFLGLIATFISLLYIIYAIYVKFFTDFTVPGWTSILISVLFLGGVQLITIGILGSYLGMIYEEVKGRPAYIIQKKIGL